MHYCTFKYFNGFIIAYSVIIIFVSGTDGSRQTLSFGHHILYWEENSCWKLNCLSPKTAVKLIAIGVSIITGTHQKRIFYLQFSSTACLNVESPRETHADTTNSTQNLYSANVKWRCYPPNHWTYFVCLTVLVCSVLPSGLEKVLLNDKTFLWSETCQWLTEGWSIFKYSTSGLGIVRL